MLRSSWDDQGRALLGTWCRHLEQWRHPLCYGLRLLTVWRSEHQKALSEDPESGLQTTKFLKRGRQRFDQFDFESGSDKEVHHQRHKRPPLVQSSGAWREERHHPGSRSNPRPTKNLGHFEKRLQHRPRRVRFRSQKKQVLRFDNVILSHIEKEGKGRHIPLAVQRRAQADDRKEKEKGGFEGTTISCSKSNQWRSPTSNESNHTARQRSKKHRSWWKK